MVAAGVTVIICLGIRRCWVRLARLGADVPPHCVAQLQFSVGHIFAATTFYALMLCIGKGTVGSTQSTFWEFVLTSVFLAMSFATVPIVTAWAALGRSPIIWKIPAAIVTIGLNSTVTIGMFVRGNWFTHLAILIVYLVAGLIVFLSLLVSRSEGYRLVLART